MRVLMKPWTTSMKREAYIGKISSFCAATHSYTRWRASREAWRSPE